MNDNDLMSSYFFMLVCPVILYYCCPYFLTHEVHEYTRHKPGSVVQKPL